MEAERRLASDASFAREVERWRARFAEFDDTTQPQPAGEALWNRIEATFAGAPPRAPQPSAWSRLWSDIAVLRTATIGASLAVLMLAVGLGVAIRQARLQPVMVAVLVDGDRTGAVVHAFADGRVVLLPLTSINVPSGRALAGLDAAEPRARPGVGRPDGPCAHARTGPEGSAPAGTQSVVRDHAGAGRRLADRAADRTDPVQGKYGADVVG